MEAYAAQRHHDAGECSEEILRNMIKVQRNYNASHLEVNTGVMNCVLNSWAECVDYDHAGARAEHILDLMERKSDKGDISMEPNHRTYNLVLRAWSKSNVSGKAEKALGILQRAKNRHLQQKLDNLPPEYTYSLVIHACAFSVNADPNVEMRAFEIAVDVMNGLINDTRTEPCSATYGWFLQVCGRLRIPEGSKNDDLERIFSRCCEKGQVNEFVLQSLKQATSDTLFSKLMADVLENNTDSFSKKGNADLKQIIQLSHLPKNWINLGCRTETKKKENLKIKSRK